MMQGSQSSGQGKRGYIYRDQRIQHRYYNQNERLDYLAKEGKHQSQEEKEKELSLMKTVEYREHDEWMFSDNKIKNCQPIFRHAHDMIEKGRHMEEGRKTSLALKGISNQVGSLYSSEKGTAEEGEVRRGSRIYSAKSKGHSTKIASSMQGRTSEMGRQATSIFEKRRNLKESSKSMQMRNQNCSQFSPTVVALKLRNCAQMERRIELSKKMAIASKMRPKKPSFFGKVMQAGTDSHKPSKSMQVQPQARSPDRMKYNINGWELDNPSFNEFDDISIGLKPEESETPEIEDLKTSNRAQIYSRPKYH